MKIVLVGGGKVGAALARQLSEEGHNVTVVDIRSSPKQSGRLAKRLNTSRLRFSAKKKTAK